MGRRCRCGGPRLGEAGAGLVIDRFRASGGGNRGRRANGEGRLRLHALGRVPERAARAVGRALRNPDSPAHPGPRLIEQSSLVVDRRAVTPSA